MMISLDEELIASIKATYGTSFTKLNLSGNHLEGVQGIERISSSLTSLNLSNNHLHRSEDLAALASLPLKNLNLSNNSMYVTLNFTV